MSEILIITIIFLFLIINIYFVVALKNRSKLNFTSNIFLNFSIIIAAKNEEKNIPSLIDSLNQLDYPKENLEVIIIDDDSSDKTYEITKKLIIDNCSFHICKAEEKEFEAKKGALDFGIKKSKNDFILITDADCRPEVCWLKAFNEKFQEGYDILFGNSPYIKNGSFVSKISCFENFRNSILTFTSSESGIPYSAASRNFGFKKSSFQRIKGYSNTIETLSGDDDLLLREAVKSNLKVGSFVSKGSFVYSMSKKSLHEYFNQRARHVKTSFYYLPGRQAILALWHSINLFSLISPLLIFYDWLFLLPFLIKLPSDLIISKALQKNFGYNFKLFEILYLQIFYELFLIINFFNALFRKDKWK